jgi:heme exporter protein D
MDLGTHADFVIAAYAVTTFVIVALVAWVTIDYSTQRRVLGEFEMQGITRRPQHNYDGTR